VITKIRSIMSIPEPVETAIAQIILSEALVIILSLITYYNILISLTGA